MQMIVTILRYVSQAAPGMTGEALRKTLVTVFPPNGGVLMKTLAQEWLEQGIEQGLEQGLEQGIERGRAEGMAAQRRTVLRILQRRFLFAEEVEQTLTDQLAQIVELDTLVQLVDDALDALLLADFQTKLQRYLQKA
jgi:flagellar biosynthesis/type III secretory pathway protein FliH